MPIPEPAFLHFPQLGQCTRRIRKCAFFRGLVGSAQDRGPRHDRNPVFLFFPGGDIGPMDLPHGAFKSIPKFFWRGSYGRREAMTCEFILHGEAPFLIFLADDSSHSRMWQPRQQYCAVPGGNPELPYSGSKDDLRASEKAATLPGREYSEGNKSGNEKGEQDAALPAQLIIFLLWKSYAATRNSMQFCKARRA